MMKYIIYACGYKCENLNSMVCNLRGVNLNFILWEKYISKVNTALNYALNLSPSNENFGYFQ